MTRKITANLLLILLIDLVLFTCSWYGAFYLRFNFSIPTDSYNLIKFTLPFVILVELTAFYTFDMYRGMWRYTSLGDLYNIIKATTLSTAFIAIAVYMTHGLTGFARSVFIINWVLIVFLTAASRLGIRIYFEIIGKSGTPGEYWLPVFSRKHEGFETDKRLIIIGAGDSGEKIFREIRDNPRLRYRIVGFVDDDQDKVGRQIHGIMIYGPTADIGNIAARLRAEELLIAISSATAAQMRTIVDHCKTCGLPFKTLPGMGELIDGKVTASSIRKVDYRDLLGREPTKLDEASIGDYLENNRVMVTGAGGSIGSELCRQIARFKPQRIVLFERAESPLYDIELDLKKKFPYIQIVPVLADIRDRQQIKLAFEANHPKVVFHAAAYKHVPMMENMPWKAIKNNIIGTRNMGEISQEFKVERFVLVSTDKAVRPSNVMGASKRVAELLVQGNSVCDRNGTRFMTVRFGNVVGSVGSVLPIFRKQLESGGPLTVTHPDVTRFFMTIPEACQLILQAGAMGEGCETFILDMGTPVKIVDMARDLIRLSGLTPDEDIKIEFIGLRPGEKLYEELITDGEGIVPTQHEKIMVIRGCAYDQEKLKTQIEELRSMAFEQDGDGIRHKLKEILPEYVIYNGGNDETVKN